MIDKNMTEAELAQKVQLWSSILTSYLKGERFPGYYTLLRIAEALDVSIDFLLGLKDEPELHPAVEKSSSAKEEEVKRRRPHKDHKQVHRTHEIQRG